MKNDAFYITTAIDYPNGPPHVGHLYEKLLADTYARWYRLIGKKVWYLTGTDENGQKLLKAAQDAKSPSTLEYVNGFVKIFRELCTRWDIQNDDFIRTTEPRHIEATQAVWKTLKERGDIYFDRYSGLYCISCEAFYAEAQANEGKCPEHGKKLEPMSADGYFFKMSRYEGWIKQHIATHKDFIVPDSARREIVSRLEQDPLRDLSISRPNQGWGIPVPDDDKHVIYTWFDALINYYAGVATPELKHFWPANVHVIGKDINWFHSVIWPTMLHAAGLAVPHQVFVHGMILGEDGKKMSKSLGNVVDIETLYRDFNGDLIRYYLLRAIPAGGDGAFSNSDLINRNNNELANDFGNLAMRVIKLYQKRCGQSVSTDRIKKIFNDKSLIEDVKSLMDAREHTRALDRIWQEIGVLNSYLNTHEPWRIKDDDSAFKQHMIAVMYQLVVITSILQVFLPAAGKKLLSVFGLCDLSPDDLEFNKFNPTLVEPAALFPKIEVAKA